MSLLFLPPHTAQQGGHRLSTTLDAVRGLILLLLISGIQTFLKLHYHTYCTYLQSEQTDKPSVIVQSWHLTISVKQVKEEFFNG